MMHYKPVAKLMAAGVALLALTGGGLKAWAEQKDADEVKIALPVEQVIASVRTAVAAKPGRVLQIEAESEGGKTMCEVKIVAADGKTYEVDVDVAANAVGEIEVDDDAENDD